MASRSPSRRSTPLSHSRDSSHRSPSFGLRGNSRRGRSPPVEHRRRKVIPRSSGPRSGEPSLRGHRGAEFRSSQRSIPPTGYQQGHFSPGSSQPGSHSPRRPSVSKRRSYTPPLSSMPSTSGKRKRIQRMRSSSSSSSSLNSPPRLPLQLPLKMKKISVERMPPSREPVMVPVRKRSRSKSPMGAGILPRGGNRFGARASGDEMKKESKGSSYAPSRPLTKVSGQFSDPPRQIENPPKRFAAEPVRRYSGEEDDSRPIYRGPDGKGLTFDQHELKKITVGIHRSLPANELQINRQIFNPEEVVLVRRPDGRNSGAPDDNEGDLFRLVSVRTDRGEIVQALSKIHPCEVEDMSAGFMETNGCISEGAKPIFDRDELRRAPHSSDDVEVKYQDRENGMRQLFRTTRDEHSRMGSQQPIEQRMVAIVDDKPVLSSTSLQSLRRQVRRSRSPIASVSHMGSSRLESISPTPMVIEKPRSYYEASPPPRMSGGYGSSSNRHGWDYEQPGPSHSDSRNTSHARHKEGRRNEDLRYELDNRRRDDASYERGSQEFRGDSDEASSDLRMRINEKRTSEHPRTPHYPEYADEPGGVHSKVVRRCAAGHHPIEVMHEPRRRGMESVGHRSSAHLPHEIDEPEDYNPRSSIQTKSSSSTIASWDGNPEYVPKGRAYYEHDNRDEWVRVSSAPRGGARGYYLRGSNRGRYFRGGYVPRGRGRGRARGRGQHMGYINRGYTRGGGGAGIRRQGASASALGGSHSTRGKPSSPSLWKHDMFENLSSDENKPTSTSESKR